MKGCFFAGQEQGHPSPPIKFPGIRAALVADAETAKGARWWNDANVLVMSLRATPEVIAKEILAAWFNEKVLPEEKGCIEQVAEIERKYSTD